MAHTWRESQIEKRFIPASIFIGQKVDNSINGKEYREKRTLEHKLFLGSGKITIKAIFMIVFYTINIYMVGSTSCSVTTTIESYIYVYVTMRTLFTD